MPAIDAHCLAEASDFVGKGDLGRMPGVIDVLDHLRRTQVCHNDRSVQRSVQLAYDTRRTLIRSADHRLRRMIVVADRRTLAQEFRVDAYAEILSGLSARGLLQYGNDGALHRTGQQRTADDHNSIAVTLGELLADLLHDATDVGQIQAAVGLSGRADTHHQNITLCDCRGIVGTREQPASGDRRSD